MIASVPGSTPIILVDNGYTNTFETVSKERSVKIIRLTSNHGFGQGCNEGAKYATTPLLLFLNPDARLGERALNSLLEGVANHPNGSAFNPRISNDNGKNYFKRRSYLLPRTLWMKRGCPKTDREVPVLSGAALLVSKRNFDLVGGFDKNIFLYHEDDDLSIRLRRFGPLFYIVELSRVSWLRAFFCSLTRNRLFQSTPFGDVKSSTWERSTAGPFRCCRQSSSPCYFSSPLQI
ncbi:glycosyltransferase [Agrobacterium radiobacter]|uniref:glycosyltransferase n=1 Tax=Agrobacterium radiobacter TaxID=362 RepID=UPI003CE57D3C